MNSNHVAREPAGRIDVGEPHPPQPHDCTAPIAQLVDVAVRNSLAFTTAALSCCTPLKACAPADGCGCGSADAADSAGSAAKRIVSSRFRTSRTDRQRRVTLETPLSTNYLFIPPERITLQPSGGRDPQLNPLGVLGPGEEDIHIKVDATGIPAAVYETTVRVRSVDGSSDQSTRVFIKL